MKMYNLKYVITAKDNFNPLLINKSDNNIDIRHKNFFKKF